MVADELRERLAAEHTSHGPRVDVGLEPPIVARCDDVFHRVCVVRSIALAERVEDGVEALVGEPIEVGCHVLDIADAEVAGPSLHTFVTNGRGKNHEVAAIRLCRSRSRRTSANVRPDADGMIDDDSSAPSTGCLRFDIEAIHCRQPLLNRMDCILFGS